YTLKSILEAEGIWAELPAEFKKEGIFLLVNNAKGSLRRAVQFLERAMLGEFYSVKDIEDNFKFLSESAGLSTLQHLIKKNAGAFNKDVEDMRRENKLADWVHLMYFFLLRQRQNIITETDYDQSPSSSALGKLPRQSFATIYTMVVDMVESMRQGSYMTSTHIAHQMLTLYDDYHWQAGLQSPEPPIAPPTEQIPVRGTK
ncbi:MAG: hypothetical protein LC650_02135, partial [Actinobacteria bacterium]|nr:hypothetical protein [Actinomycetota bacterium]